MKVVGPLYFTPAMVQVVEHEVSGFVVCDCETPLFRISSDLPARVAEALTTYNNARQDGWDRGWTALQSDLRELLGAERSAS